MNEITNVLEKSEKVQWEGKTVFAAALTVTILSTTIIAVVGFLVVNSAG